MPAPQTHRTVPSWNIPAAVRGPVLTAHDVGGPAALQSLLADGVLVPLWGPTALPGDIPSTPTLRAHVLAGLLPRGAVVGRRTAVWVHTGSNPCRRISLLVRPAARRPSPHTDRWVYEADLGPDDVVLIAGVPVTSVLRTALDVARWTRGREREQLLDSLVDGASLDVDAAIAALASLSGYRHVATARAALGHVARDPATPAVQPLSSATFEPVIR